MNRNLEIPVDDKAGTLWWLRALTAAAAAMLFAAVSLPVSAQEKAEAEETKTEEQTQAQEEPQETPVEIPFHLQPYRVLISVAFDETPLISNSYRRDVLEGIEQAVERTIGHLWSVTVEENSRLFPATVSTLERLSFDDVLHQLGIEIITPEEETSSRRSSTTSRPQVTMFQESPYDKVFLVTVESHGAGYRMAAREWDESSRQIGPTEVDQTYDRRASAETAFRLVQNAFRPVLLIERASPETAELWLKAGAFPAADPEATQIRPGTLIAPFYRYYNKEKVVRRTQFVPWTYLRVEEVDGGYLKCSIISGLRAPLGTAGRRRTDVMGMVLKSQVDSTLLKMALRTNPNKPLAGYRVTVENKLLVRDEPKAPPKTLITDRRGQLRLDHDPENPMRWLYIHSGKVLLARLPFATGVSAEETFLLPDDSLRLSVEGDLILLQGKLIDTVARRSTHLARAQLLAKKEQWQEVDKVFAEIDSLPAAEEFLTRLNTIREPAMEKAEKSGNRTAEFKIKKMCDDMSELINRYLNPEFIVEQRTLLNEPRGGN